MLLRPGVYGKVRFCKANHTRVATARKIMIYFTNLVKAESFDLLVNKILKSMIVAKVGYIGNEKVRHNV